MRNYIRYIILLVLIIAGGLLVISVINKFSEPDVSKVNNGAKTEETTTVDKEDKPSLDVDTTETDTTDTSTDTENSESSSTSGTNTNDNEIDNVTVPNTATGDKTEGTTENIPTYSQYKGNIIISEEEK